MIPVIRNIIELPIANYNSPICRLFKREKILLINLLLTPNFKSYILTPCHKLIFQKQNQIKPRTHRSLLLIVHLIENETLNH